jgi:hypothetical protein
VDHTLLTVGGYVLTAILAVLAFFLKKALSDVEDEAKETKLDMDRRTAKFYEELKERDKKNDTLYQSFDTKLTNLAHEYDVKLAEFHKNIGQKIDDFKEKVSEEKDQQNHTSSAADLRLEDKVETIKKDLSDTKIRVAERYVTREDFIRESTILETRITSTRKAIESLDETLRRQVEG